jgi:hypothetical protein
MRSLMEGNDPAERDAFEARLSCKDDPIDSLRQMFVDVVMGSRIRRSQKPARRPVFRKTHGVAQGTFTIRADLPEDLKVGIFRGGEYRAVVRFSSDTGPSQPDLKSTVGMAIKLFGVEGQKLLTVDASTCDFLLQNHDVFFVDTAKDMCEFTYAGVIEGDYRPYLEAHPLTAQILDAMEKVVPSVFTTTYWGLLPHRFGDGRFVKYKLVQAFADDGAPLEVDPTSLPNYLYVDLKTWLLRRRAGFDLFVQFQSDPDAMPLDRATVRWDEVTSPPVHVATLELPRQNIDAPGQAECGENLSFNIWQTLPVHEPQGSIAVARKVAYYGAAGLRRSTNDVPIEEPSTPCCGE